MSSRRTRGPVFVQNAFAVIEGQNWALLGFRRILHERLLLDKNLWSQHAGQIRWFPPVTETVEF